MPPSVRMMVIDIDGTLLPSAGTAVSPRNCEAVREIQAAGIEVVIATGRRQAYAMPLLTPVGLAPETVLITSNGTVTRTISSSARAGLSRRWNRSRQTVRSWLDDSTGNR